ncbi:polyprenyl synthetase family protein [Microbacterium murale]|uniref:Geranylgeranyl pyrophosphate synthase n=1 Tax=Microbacterium murale TaxID=1081040 RepID=A0ABU0P7P7_9MICO|nr:polyprenyl synthetase family protein [Microbacterium murale]MDQ0643363.1 geranylgeranyl pyrophosphate synthase [Microbacterium murale]
MGDPDVGVDVTAVFDARLTEILAHRRGRSQAFSAPYAQLWDALERMALGGKKVRPRLLLNAHTALGGTDERAAVDAACAIELLHVALVIHDDVIDRDLVRRGEMNITGRFASEALLRGAPRRAAHAWGESSSLLAGDLMLTLAHSVLARLDVDERRRQAALEIFDETVFESAAGEHHDVWLSMHLESATSDDVLAMVDQKTAAYSFQAPLTLAAVLAGAPPVLVAELAVIARRIGVIYQLRDDVLGVFGDERETGKSTSSDLREGKETLLVSYARSDAAWATVAPYFGDDEMSASEGESLRRVIEESGALLFVESLISDRCDEVHRLIRESQLPAPMAEQLVDLVSTCRTRTS